MATTLTAIPLPRHYIQVNKYTKSLKKGACLYWHQ